MSNNLIDEMDFYRRKRIRREFYRSFRNFFRR